MNYTEEDLEDWVCANIGTVVNRSGETTVVGRQIDLPIAGRLDVLAVTSRYNIAKGKRQSVYTLIEIKRASVDQAAVSQALRYAGALRKCHRGLEDDGQSYLEVFVCAPDITDKAALAVEASESVTYVKLKPHLSIDAERWAGITFNDLTPEVTDPVHEIMHKPVVRYWKNGGSEKKAVVDAGYRLWEMVISGHPVWQLGHRHFIPDPDTPEEDLHWLMHNEDLVNAVIRYSTHNPELLDFRRRQLPAPASDE